MDKKVLNILLVEDDEVDILNVKRAFRKQNLNHDLSIVRDAIQALEYLRDSSNILPHVVLLDINMPKMNGIEFLREIRKDKILSYLTVFILTTSNSDNDKFEAYNLNVAGYILKPVMFESFISAIKTLDDYWNFIEL